MVVSEFARTPALNSANGKDHNPLTNSVLLAGAGIKGNQSFGASLLVRRHHSKTGQPRHSGGLVNYPTGAVARSIEEARSKDYPVHFP